MKKKYCDFIKKSIKQIECYSPWPLFYPWRMSKNEKKIFDITIKKSKKYLEFGSGGSTIRALQKSNAKIYSVDSSKDWIKFMRKYLFIRYFERKRLNFFHINIGPTKEWGVPVDDSLKHLYPQFSSKIFEILNTENLDTFLVDGRFRVACVLSTIIYIHTSGNYKKIIIIHDFWNREYYHIVMQYLRVINKVETLGVFSIKEDLNITEVKQNYEKYKFDAR